MVIIDFIKSLLTRLKKDDIIEDLRITAGELETGVIPAYENASKFFKSSKFKSEDVSDIVTVFYRNYNNGKVKQGNLITDINDCLKDLRTNLKFVMSEAEACLEHDIIKEGLTAKKANVIRSSEYFSFLTRHALDLLNLILIEETKEAGGEIENLPPIREKVIKDNVINFARLLTIYGDIPTRFKKRFEELPDVVLNDKTYSALSGIYQNDKLDVSSTFLVTNFEENPIYHLRLIVAEWQANRYKSFKDKKRMLELRLLNLKLVSEDNPDPQLQKEINYIQSRIESIEYKMKKMEESVS